MLSPDAPLADIFRVMEQDLATVFDSKAFRPRLPAQQENLYERQRARKTKAMRPNRFAP